MINSKFKYFLAANSGEGFVSYFEDFIKNADGFHIFIIKGGPGTGKSSFMKKMAKKASENEIEAIFCPCSSDPDSLDGVIFPELKIAIFDGTAPHILEPRLVGVKEEILNFGEFWQSKCLKDSKEKIEKLTKENKFLHTLASNYIKSASLILKNDYLKACDLCLTEKAEKYAEYLCKKELKRTKGAKGKESICFLTGVTPKGIIGFEETVLKLSKKQIIIADKYGAFSNIVLASLRKSALLYGLDIITVKNPFLPSCLLDAVVIPCLNLSFLREYDFLSLSSPSRRIHAERFYNPAPCLSQNLYPQILETAVDTLKKAKSVHDQLEKEYIKAMDFGALESFAEKFSTILLGDSKTQTK